MEEIDGWDHKGLLFGSTLETMHALFAMSTNWAYMIHHIYTTLTNEATVKWKLSFSSWTRPVALLNIFAVKHIDNMIIAIINWYQCVLQIMTNTCSCFGYRTSLPEIQIILKFENPKSLVSFHELSTFFFFQIDRLREEEEKLKLHNLIQGHYILRCKMTCRHWSYFLSLLNHIIIHWCL